MFIFVRSALRAELEQHARQGRGGGLRPLLHAGGAGRQHHGALQEHHAEQQLLGAKVSSGAKALWLPDARVVRFYLFLAIVNDNEFQ